MACSFALNEQSLVSRILIELIIGLHAVNSDEHSLLTLESLLIKWILAVVDVL